ncbi:MAG TPA: ATP-binding protein [Tepidisphaeraceae bacterium]|nr:ATP-binding protein [Tepidisphaeraceae bacterium]
MKFTFSSSYAAMRDVQKAILDEVDRNGYTGAAAYAIKIALDEGLINAVKHGNKLDPKKNVRVEANINSEQAEIIIHDEGVGFKRTDVPDPTAEENLEKCSGRGILLIEAYMTEVEWSDSGRRIRMIKKNEQEAVNT